MAEFKHGDWNILGAMDALMAYDVGYTDSGVRDPELKKAVVEYLLNLEFGEFQKVEADFIQRFYLSDRAASFGYGQSDILEFKAWLVGLVSRAVMDRWPPRPA